MRLEVGGRGQLVQDLADRQWKARRFRDIAADRDKGRAGGLEPERVAAALRRKQHHSDALQIVIKIRWIAAHITERIVARGAPVFLKRIEQMDLLTVGRPKSCGAIPILLLDVENNDGIRPIEQVRNDIADALAGAGRCIDQDVFGASETQQRTVLASEQDAFSGTQARSLDLALGSETRAAVKRERTVTEDRTEHAEHHNDAGERRQRQPAIEARVSAVTRPARGDLRPVEATVVNPQSEQQNI